MNSAASSLTFPEDLPPDDEGADLLADLNLFSEGELEDAPDLQQAALALAGCDADALAPSPPLVPACAGSELADALDSVRDPTDEDFAALAADFFGAEEPASAPAEQHTSTQPHHVAPATPRSCAASPPAANAQPTAAWSPTVLGQAAFSAAYSAAYSAALSALGSPTTPYGHALSGGASEAPYAAPPQHSTAQGLPSVAHPGLTPQGAVPPGPAAGWGGLPVGPPPQQPGAAPQQQVTAPSAATVAAATASSPGAELAALLGARLAQRAAAIGAAAGGPGPGASGREQRCSPTASREAFPAAEVRRGCAAGRSLSFVRTFLLQENSYLTLVSGGRLSKALRPCMDQACVARAGRHT
jgi:hypothetical protein